MHVTRPTRYVVAAMAVLALLSAACGSDGKSKNTASRAKTVTVKAVDYGFEGLPARIPAGTALKLTNQSPNEAHELVAVRLPDGERRPAAELAKLPDYQLMGLFSGPPALVLVAPPAGGDQVVAQGDGTLKEPGRYVVLCTVPTGADPAAFLNSTGQVQGGAPHFAHGMYAELIVE
jgi:plastocyanin